jgi:hypothetical protein
MGLIRAAQHPDREAEGDQRHGVGEGVDLVDEGEIRERRQRVLVALVITTARGWNMFQREAQVEVRSIDSKAIWLEVLLARF